MPHVILDQPQTAIEIDGCSYPIYTDFKDWLDFYILLTRPGAKEDTEMLITALAMVLPEMPVVDGGKLADALLAFLKNEPTQQAPDPGTPLLMKDIKKDKDEEPLPPRVLDYEHDGDLIFAGFMQAYGINLSEAAMHWHQWQALLSGLPEACLLRKIMGWRAATPSDLGKMSKDEAAHIRKMQRIYALPDTRTQDEIDAEFAAAF